jgi:predicted 3-demethylubiquinone-9 3-methyltransferase (glyoxalase superfamily)
MQKITPFLWFDAQAEEANTKVGMRIAEVTTSNSTTAVETRMLKAFEF